MKLLVVDRIQPQSNKFATSVENEAMGDLKLNGSPEDYCIFVPQTTCTPCNEAESLNQ